MAAKFRGLLRDKQILQMRRFPDPIQHFDSTAVRVEVSGRYAQVRIRLADLADELAESHADIVLAVLD